MKITAQTLKTIRTAHDSLVAWETRANELAPAPRRTGKEELSSKNNKEWGDAMEKFKQAEKAFNLLMKQHGAGILELAERGVQNGG